MGESKGEAVPSRTMDSINQFITKRRIPLSFILVTALAAANYAIGFSPRALHLDDGVGLLGAALVVAGALLRSWSAGLIRKQNVLSTSGPYTFTRHPLYLGAGLIATGFSIILANWMNPAIVLALFVLLYIPKIRAEEKLLAGKFGEQWTRYVERTSGLIPRRAPVEERASWSLRQWARNHEYHALLTCLFTLALIEVLRRYAAASDSGVLEAIGQAASLK